ncbi:arginine--tRNA ligase [Actinospica sp.]|uniref:arginine--tRNA ligase n=1 Tax=Actinospica sp. TaxID=1872142 RepID=UPI002BFA8B36|nr:arginine--tRNA ligase [Actinospica sp.]HWG26919.1 arginine--tRNA ligase [Actinospica sp.]
MPEVLGAKDLVDAAVAQAMVRVLPRELAAGDPLVRRSDRADYQSNAALGLAKKAGIAPRELAQALLDSLTGDLAAELSGPGFLNITLTDAALWHIVAARLADEQRMGVGAPAHGTRTLVDYSGPNIAKQLHVGHIRSTVIGDALVRVLTYLGADVVKVNHLGDWGTAFGKPIQYIDEHTDLSLDSIDLDALDDVYKAAQQQFVADPEFAVRARARVVALQSGDEATLAAWHKLVEVSMDAFQALYQRLGILLTPEDAVAESFYNPWLGDVVSALDAKGLLTESEGAQCVFLDGFADSEGRPLPLIVRKSDGGYGYAATDLAAVRYRVEEVKAKRMLYVIDARQALHLRMVFETARQAGWLPDDVEAVHIPFGTILGTDGRPFRSRSGDTPRLKELLDAAIAGARAVVAEKSAELPPEEFENVVQAAGIGAVKYADLSNARIKDYVFDPDRMVSLTGNTSVYLQYAHARTCSVLRKADALLDTAADVDPAVPIHRAERSLILTLDEFGAVLAEVGTTLEPHRLCTYLYELAKAFSDFWQNCPVLKADGAAQRGNRVALVRLTQRTLAQGLDLLGISAPQRL